MAPYSAGYDVVGFMIEVLLRFGETPKTHSTRPRFLFEFLVDFEAIWEASWGHVGTFWCRFWASWKDLGAILGSSWGVLEGLGKGLEASWTEFGSNLWIFWIRYGGTHVASLSWHIFLLFVCMLSFCETLVFIAPVEVFEGFFNVRFLECKYCNPLKHT